MSHIGVLGVVGLTVIILALVLWITMIVRARRNPAVTKAPDDEPGRGPISGGVIRGDPGQVILTGEAPREDELRREDEAARDDERRRNGPLDL
jgi:hypothetical protein